MAIQTGSFGYPNKISGQEYRCVIRGVNGYTRNVGKYVTGRSKRFRPYKVYVYILILAESI